MASTGLRRTMIELCHLMAHDLLGTYRPELHYMRGPGPKWREKHQADSPVQTRPQGELVHAHA